MKISWCKLEERERERGKEWGESVVRGSSIEITATYLFQVLGVPQKIAHNDDTGEIKAKISALSLSLSLSPTLGKLLAKALREYRWGKSLRISAVADLHFLYTQAGVELYA